MSIPSFTNSHICFVLIFSNLVWPCGLVFFFAKIWAADYTSWSVKALIVIHLFSHTTLPESSVSFIFTQLTLSQAADVLLCYCINLWATWQRNTFANDSPCLEIVRFDMLLGMLLCMKIINNGVMWYRPAHYFLYLFLFYFLKNFYFSCTSIIW